MSRRHSPPAASILRAKRRFSAALNCRAFQCDRQMSPLTRTPRSAAAHSRSPIVGPFLLTRWLASPRQSVNSSRSPRSICSIAAYSSAKYSLPSISGRTALPSVHAVILVCGLPAPPP